MKTQADLVVEVLDLLGVTEVGQAPSDEDFEKVQAKIAEKFGELSRRNIYYVQNPDAIDDEVFGALSTIVANAVAPKFGQPRDPAVDAREEFRLRDIDRTPCTRAVMQTEFL